MDKVNNVREVPSAQDPSSIVDRLREFSKDELNHDDVARKTALGLARKLVGSLGDPINTATEMVFSPFIATAARIGVDLNLYELIEQRQGASITTTELSKRSGGDPLLVNRILRMLASVGFVAQVGGDEWTSTPVTKAMAMSPIMAGHRFVWDVLITSTVNAPKYLREANSICPTQPTDGFIQYTHQTKYNVFDYLAKVQPQRLDDFNHFMGNTMGARNYWVDWYPVKEKLLNSWQPGTTLLVDVAGGKGHDLQAFRNKYPDATGTLVLQDLPQALDSIRPGELDDTVARQTQDFFQPNQVRGAKAYFLHHILHDWSEEFALRILGHLRDVMTPGYSKLLIHDLILPDVDISTFQAVFDMTMMTFNGGMERNRSQWTDLLQKAGFKVVEFWHGQDGEDADGIVEAIIEK